MVAVAPPSGLSAHKSQLRKCGIGLDLCAKFCLFSCMGRQISEQKEEAAAATCEQTALLTLFLSLRFKCVERYQQCWTKFDLSVL